MLCSVVREICDAIWAVFGSGVCDCVLHETRPHAARFASILWIQITTPRFLFSIECVIGFILAKHCSRRPVRHRHRHHRRIAAAAAGTATHC